jgi:hypothetical protein
MFGWVKITIGWSMEASAASDFNGTFAGAQTHVGQVSVPAYLPKLEPISKGLRLVIAILTTRQPFQTQQALASSLETLSTGLWMVNVSQTESKSKSKS